MIECAWASLTFLTQGYPFSETYYGLGRVLIKNPWRRLPSKGSQCTRQIPKLNPRIIKGLQTRQTTPSNGQRGQPPAPVAVGRYGIQAWSRPSGLTLFTVPTCQRHRGYLVDRRESPRHTNRQVQREKQVMRDSSKHEAKVSKRLYSVREAAST
jgi:hypothetical protein